MCIYIYTCYTCVCVYCIVSYCIVLHCIVLVLYYVISYHIVLHYIVLCNMYVYNIYIYVYIYIYTYPILFSPVSPQGTAGWPNCIVSGRGHRAAPIDTSKADRCCATAKPTPGAPASWPPAKRRVQGRYKLHQNATRWYKMVHTKYTSMTHTPHLAASLRNRTSASRSSQQTSQIFTAFECQEIPPSFCESWGHLQTSDWCARSIGPLLALPGSVVSMRKSFSHWQSLDCFFYKNLQVWHAQLKKLWLWWSLYSDLKHTGWVVRLSVSLLIK